MYHQRTKDRGAFTLIELLVVISILGLLMALLLPAIQKIRVRGEVVKASSQINQLAMACNQFKIDNGVFPPDNATDALAAIQRMYPRGGFTSYAPSGVSTSNQWLVHFLQGPTGTGWPIDATGGVIVPPSGTATGTRKGPWLTFQSSELSGNTVIDPWGQALKYRASGTGGAYPTPPTPPTSDWFTPYSDGTKSFNFGGVQIISNGPNRRPGSGGPSLPLAGQDGADDLANFNGGYQLGSRQ
jgi:prepilin-type N-terminal cleavage/methylation domain-containing protein